MDYSKKLPNGVWIDTGVKKFFQPVVYEGLSLICFNCGLAGHKDIHCQNNTSRVARPSGVAPHVLSAKGGLEKTIAKVNDIPHPPTQKEAIPTFQNNLPPPPLPVALDDNGYGGWSMVVNRKAKFKKRGNSSTSTREQVAYKPPAAPTKKMFRPTGKTFSENMFHSLANVDEECMIEEPTLGNEQGSAVDGLCSKNMEMDENVAVPPFLTEVENGEIVTNDWPASLEFGASALDEEAKEMKNKAKERSINSATTNDGGDASPLGLNV